MEDHGDIGSLPDKIEALQLIFRLETDDKVGRGMLVPNPGGLPKGPETLPTDVTSKPGYYVGVTRATDNPRYIYLVRLADPRYVVGETHDPEGKIDGVALLQAGGVLSTRVPFIPEGRLIICEVLAGERNVLVHENLGRGPFPADGRDFKAKER